MRRLWRHMEDFCSIANGWAMSSRESRVSQFVRVRRDILEEAHGDFGTCHSWLKRRQIRAISTLDLMVRRSMWQRLLILHYLVNASRFFWYSQFFSINKTSLSLSFGFLDHQDYAQFFFLLLMFHRWKFQYFCFPNVCIFFIATHSKMWEIFFPKIKTQTVAEISEKNFCLSEIFNFFLFYK